MKKITTLLAVIGWVIIMVSMLFRLMHLRHIALYLSRASIYVFIAWSLICLIWSDQVYPPLLQYNQRFNFLRRIFFYILIVGGLIALSGPVMSQFHLPGSRLLLFWGIIIVMLGFILLGILIAAKKKYYVMPASTSDFTIDHAMLQSYSGVYFSEALQKSMIIIIDREVMFAQLSGQDSFALAAVKEAVFNNLQFGVVLEFPTQNELVLVQRGKYLPFLRKE